jgi:molybdopterin synthase sulfur carrier subunit
MAVRVLFLGPLGDLAGTAEREFEAPLDWPGLLEALDPPLAKAVTEPRVNVACGGKVLGDKTALDAKDGDEVALLPPVSGG